MVDTGYESYNAITNLGSLSVFLFMYILRVMYYILLWLYVKKTKKGSKRLKSLRNVLFFNELITLFIDGYFEFLISGYLQVTHPSRKGMNGEVIAFYIGIAGLFIAGVSIPLGFMYMMFFYSTHQLSHSGLKNRFGSLYHNLRLKNKYQIAYL